MAASLLEELLGLKTNKAPGNPWEATEPTTKRDQHDAANPLVGASAAPTPPPTTDTLAVRQVEAEERWKQFERLSDELAGLRFHLEKQNSLRRAENDRGRPTHEPCTIPFALGPSAGYVVKAHGRFYNRLFSPAAQLVTVVLPGIDPATITLAPGWNPLDVPEGTRIYSTQASFSAVFSTSNKPFDLGPYEPSSVARLLFKSAASVDVHAGSGLFVANLDVSQVSTLFVSFTLLTLTGGTSPSVQIQYQAMDVFGNEAGMGSVAALTSVNTQISNIGQFTQNGGTNLQQMLPQLINIAWITAGAPATATAQLAVYGR